MPRQKTAAKSTEPDLPELEIVGLLHEWEADRRVALAERARQGDTKATKKLARLRAKDRQRERARQKEEARRAALTPAQRAAEDRSWEEQIEAAFAARRERFLAKAKVRDERRRLERVEKIAAFRAEQEALGGKSPRRVAREAAEATAAAQPRPRRRPNQSYSTSFVD